MENSSTAVEEATVSTMGTFEPSGMVLETWQLGRWVSGKNGLKHLFEVASIVWNTKSLLLWMLLWSLWRKQCCSHTKSCYNREFSIGIFVWVNIVFSRDIPWGIHTSMLQFLLSSQQIWTWVPSCARPPDLLSPGWCGWSHWKTSAWEGLPFWMNQVGPPKTSGQRTQTFSKGFCCLYGKVPLQKLDSSWRQELLTSMSSSAKGCMPDLM